MPEYTYAEPKDPAEASARIQHWMGDLGEFQTRLGLHDPGNGHEPYYPKYSGVRSENSRIDTMIAVDQRLRPDKWIEAIAPVPPLRDSWLSTLIRTRDETKRFIDTWTDLDFIKGKLRVFVKDTTKRVQGRLLGWLGEKTSPPLPTSKWIPLQSWPTSREHGGPPYDLDTYAKVQRDIAEEKTAERGDDEDLFT